MVEWSLDNCLENHTLNNCVISCIDCNKARSNKPFKQFYRESVLRSFPNPTIYIIDEANKNVAKLMRKNIVGGPSIVYHRYHLKDVTRIQQLHYDIPSKTWWYDNFGKFGKKILGLDCNTLYLWCIAQAQLCGILKYYDVSLCDPNTLIQNIINESSVRQQSCLWGCVEVDIHVPEYL